MYKRIGLALFLALLVVVGNAQNKKGKLYGVAFYNLENMFDTVHDEGKNDYEYLPDGRNKWDEMKVFMNICLQQGENEAISEFIGKSFSVYGRSVTYINPDLPKWDVTVLDDWEKTIYN